MDVNEIGLTFVPRYVRQVSDMEYGSVISHENYNEKLNLNSSQGDYNTEVLRLLLGETDKAKTFHVPYLDKEINDRFTGLDERFDNLQGQIDTHTEQITDIDEGLDSARQDILKIINGTITVAKANKANSITGVENAGKHRYYGTNYNNQVGFHEVPDGLYAREFSDAHEYITDIIFTPAENSVAEDMLTEDVRAKLNRTSITDYEELTSLPKINGTTLIGDTSLSGLGIQPVGNYLTEVPNTYALKTYVDDAVSPKLNSADAATTYATITALNTLSAKVPDNLSSVVDSYIRVGINAPVSNPRTGDLYITV